MMATRSRPRCGLHLGGAGEIDEGPECRWQVTPARIIEVVAGVQGAPILQDAQQASLGDELFDLRLEREGDAGAFERGADGQSRVAERQPAFDLDRQSRPVALELPRVEAAARKAEPDAGEVPQVLR